MIFLTFESSIISLLELSKTLNLYFAWEHKDCLIYSTYQENYLKTCLKTYIWQKFLGYGLRLELQYIKFRTQFFGH